MADCLPAPSVADIDVGAVVAGAPAAQLTHTLHITATLEGRHITTALAFSLIPTLPMADHILPTAAPLPDTAALIQVTAGPLPDMAVLIRRTGDAVAHP